MVIRGTHSADRIEHMPLLRRSIPRKICRAIEQSGAQKSPAPAQKRITLL
jgi:hypothetical protein